MNPSDDWLSNSRRARTTRVAGERLDRLLRVSRPPEPAASGVLARGDGGQSADREPADTPGQLRGAEDRRGVGLRGVTRLAVTISTLAARGRSGVSRTGPCTRRRCSPC